MRRSKYRQRYLDLIANEPSRDMFRKRIAIVRSIRRFLDERGFPGSGDADDAGRGGRRGGGAVSRPTHNALGMDLYLRIAPELYLKRLLVGGFPKVFELNRNFRNEGISRRHNPEFTMLEAYWAFADFEQMAELVEEMVCHLAQTVLRRTVDRAQGRRGQCDQDDRPDAALEARALFGPDQIGRAGMV